MRTKTARINIRTTPSTKGVWLDLCRILDGDSQTEIFEMVIMSIAKQIIDDRSIVQTLKQIKKG
jgi:uncharacterized protein (DUF1778 family)